MGAGKVGRWPRERRAQRGNAAEPARLFLGLGLTVFGGSAALRHSSSNPY